MSRTVLALALLAMAAPCLAQDDKPQEDLNAAFENPNVSDYVDRFESESREVFTKREAIADVLNLEPGTSVADIGAGTGLFTRVFAEKVGPEGKVYAVDISPAFLEYIRKEAKKAGHQNVRPIRGSQETTNLPPDSVDVAFIADAYHHFEKTDAMLGSIVRALKPGGRLVMVEFDRSSGKRNEFMKRHIRADPEVFIKEIEEAGFERVEGVDTPDLEENFIAVFRKVDDKDSGEPQP